MAKTTNKDYPRFHPDDDLSEPPPIFGNFFEGWTSLFSNSPSKNSESPRTTNNQQQQQQQQQQQSYEADRSSTISSLTASTSTRTSSVYDDHISRRKNSVQLGRQVMSEILENDNVSNAIQILQQALDHLQMTSTEGEDEGDVSKIYSQIIKSLCDPNIASIVDEMSKKDGKVPDIQESVLWRLFTKVVESGYVLEVIGMTT
jgi:signal recognition particle GTPase